MRPWGTLLHFYVQTRRMVRLNWEKGGTKLAPRQAPVFAEASLGKWRGWPR